MRLRGRRRRTLTWLVELHQVVDDDVGHPEILIMNIITILTKRALRDLSFQTISNFFIKKIGRISVKVI